MRKLFLLLLAPVLFTACLKDDLEDLQNQLDQEVLNRVNGDYALRNDLNASFETLQQAIADESSAREAGDVELADNLAAAITQLNSDILDEANAREAGDNELAESLQSNVIALTVLLDTERAARMEGNVALSSAVGSLAAEVAQGLSALQDGLAAEAAARASGDSALASRIAGVNSNLASSIASTNEYAVNARTYAIGRVETLQGELQSAIDAVSENVTNLETTVLDELQPAIEALRNRVNNLNFVTNSELETMLEAIVSELQKYADDNDEIGTTTTVTSSNTTVVDFDDTELRRLIQEITDKINDNESDWLEDQFEADTTLNAAAITQEIADAIAAIPSSGNGEGDGGVAYDDSALRSAIADLQAAVTALQDRVAALEPATVQDLRDAADDVFATFGLTGGTSPIDAGTFLIYSWDRLDPVTQITININKDGSLLSVNVNHDGVDSNYTDIQEALNAINAITE